ncbi:MAG: PTS system mannose/fructose/sorbose family transporter subunit IID [Candidatus Thermoplasmatota archaeon]|nr:PTS system mannose/fructose/sorbose family transporter subunit IID [Candidatus Thermoplasmatota archaeon]
MISLGAAIACGVLAFLCIQDWLSVKIIQGMRPLMAGAIAGIILGNFQAGLIIGAFLELMAMGVYTYGGATTPDYIGGAIIGTALAVTTPSWSIGAIAPIAIGIASLFIPFDIIGRTVNTFFMHLGDRYAETLDFRKLEMVNWLGVFPWGLSRAIPTFIGVYFVDQASVILGAIPESIIAGFAVAGALLPALGIGMLLKVMPARSYFTYGILGFVIAAYLNFILPALGLEQANFMGTITVGLTLIGLAIGFIVLNLKYGEETFVASGETSEERKGKRLTDKDLRRVFLRNYVHTELSWNYERMQGFDYFYAIRPALQKIYDKAEDLKEMVKLHMSFFNTNPIMMPVILGADVAIEEEKGIESRDLILAIKTGTMGPLAGIGDTLIYATINTILFSIGASWAIEGNPLGFIFVLIAGNAIYLPMRYYGFRLGYREGMNVARALGSDTRIKHITELTTIIGMMVVGGLAPLFVRVAFVGEITIAGAVVPSIQRSLDSIFPFLFPGLMVLLVYYLLEKNWKPTYVLLLLFALGLICGSLGILGAA